LQRLTQSVILESIMVSILVKILYKSFESINYINKSIIRAVMDMDIKIKKQFRYSDGMNYDDIFEARDELFENKLTDGLRRHKKFLKLLQ